MVARPMKILAIDTASSACSVAVLSVDRIVAHRRRELARGHAEILLPMVEEAMRAAHLSFDALDLVAVTVGPGAFTGIRIGLSAARGIALAAGKSSLGVTTFEAIAEAARPVGAGERLLLSVDSRREDVFFLAAPPDAGIATGPERVADWAPAGPLVVAGERGAAVAALLPDRVAQVRRIAPDAACVARIAARRWSPGMPSNPPRPLYLREADTTLPKR